MVQLLPPSCETCGAAVPASSMIFHREWHAAQEGRGRQFWETEPEPSLSQMTSLVAALKALPPVSARPEFVTGLRARLMAEAMSNPDT